VVHRRGGAYAGQVIMQVANNKFILMLHAVPLRLFAEDHGTLTEKCTSETMDRGAAFD
jgi:hypothetical protein